MSGNRDRRTTRQWMRYARRCHKLNATIGRMPYGGCPTPRWQVAIRRGWIIVRPRIGPPIVWSQQP